MAVERNEIKLPHAYIQDVLVRLAHHSSAIEGSTISLPDTVSILLHNTVPGQTNLRELYEVANHKQAFQLVLDHIAKQTPLSTTMIKDIHEQLMDRLLADRGKFKSHEKFIFGADFTPASPHETPLLMEQWVDNLNYQLEQVVSEQPDLLHVLADFHIQFERIHPFSDGNGRTGRLVMMYSLLERGYPPLVIRGEQRTRYFQYLARQDIAGLTQLFAELLAEEMKRYQGFVQMAAQQIEPQDPV